MKKTHRLTTRLTAKLERNLLAYATVATAAAGMGAMAAPSEASVTYTPTHVRIGDNTAIPLDLNNDGKADFTLRQTFAYTNYVERYLGTLRAVPSRPANQVVGYSGYFVYASALAAGVHIGPKKSFAAGEKILAWGGHLPHRSTGTCFGPWVNVKRHYLGLRFVIGGKVHFGWARLNETCAGNGDDTAVLTGYAYETETNKPIVAGDRGPGSLGKLALGAVGKH